MNRRHFIAMLSMAPVAVAVAKMLPKASARTWHMQDAAGGVSFDGGRVEWQPSHMSHMFHVGDTVVISGCVNEEFNGTYRKERGRIFERIS